MAEAQRARPMEYYNPRFLILGACFFWGVAMGFCLFYFSPPKQMTGQDRPAGTDEPAAPRTQLTDQERRRLDEPVLAQVEPAPDTAERQPAFETMLIEPHMPAVTTEGGLTGRTARQLAARTPRVYSVPASVSASSSTSASAGNTARPAAPSAPPPPPIPELMP